MAFTKTTWVDGTTPITAAQLNRIETGIEDAHAGSVDAGFREAIGVYAGQVDSNLATGTLPSGWTVSKDSAGVCTITHNLGTALYAIVATVAALGYTASYISRTTTSVKIRIRNEAGSSIDAEFTFIVVEL